MTDPYGALAMQRKGDLGIFDGAQWASSSAGQNIFNKAPGQANIYHGTAVAPVHEAKPTFLVSRTELIASGVSPNPGDPFYNAAIVGAVDSLPGNKVQPTGIYGVADGEAIAGAYAIGGFFEGVVTSGAGSAMGVFALASTSTNTSAGPVGVNPTIQILNATNYAWGVGAAFGLDIDLETSGATNYASAAVGIRTGGGALWDVGVGISSACNIRTAAFEDDSNSPTVFKITGSHTTLIDVSGATITNTWHGAFSTDNEVKITRATGSAYFLRLVGTGTGARTWGLSVLNSGNLTFDDVTAPVSQMALGTGTPGANFTNLTLLEGAVPTARRLKTFDPGAAGINFTAGQLVCVLV